MITYRSSISTVVLSSHTMVLVWVVRNLASYHEFPALHLTTDTEFHKRVGQFRFPTACS